MTTLPDDEWKQFCDVMNGYIYSQTLATSCDFDLFTFLSKRGGANLEDVQTGLSLSQYSAKVLLLACCAAGLIRRDENSGKYFNSVIADKILVSDSPHSIIPFVRFNHSVRQRCSVHLTRSLKEGRNAGLDEIPGGGTTLYKRLAGCHELENLFQEATGVYTRLSPNIVDQPEFSQVVNLPDVGGGDGTTASGEGMAYPGKDHERWQHEVGFSSVKRLISKRLITGR
jgi:hypothetical protein